MLQQKGGAMGALQSADEQLAVKYGIPITAVQTVRKALGIPDVRKAPDANQVLPKGWMWKYDLLDANGVVVNPADYHWGNIPRVAAVANNVGTNVFVAAEASAVINPTDALEAMLKMLQANPSLLESVK